MTKQYIHLKGLFTAGGFANILPVTMGIILLSGLLAGCIGGTSPKSLYYVLDSSMKISAEHPLNNEYSLGVGPIKIPGFLKRPQIVTRQGENLLTINEFHRWGDSLEAQITSGLVENLSIELNTPKVITYPWVRFFSPDYQLYINFRRFDGNPGESVIVDATWRVVDIKNDKELLTRSKSLIVPTRGKGYQPYVTALDTALEKLSQKIAHGILLLIGENTKQ